MAKAAAELEQADAAGGSQSPSIAAGVPFARLCAAVSEFIRVARPDVTECELLLRSPHGDRLLKSSMEIPLIVSEQSLEDKILMVMAQMRPGAWMKGAAIAVQVGAEYGSGSFGGVLSRLSRDDGPMESSRNGYRLREK